MAAYGGRAARHLPDQAAASGRAILRLLRNMDRHNRCRHDDLMLEREFVTMDWSGRVGHSLLGMIIVDSWLLYVGARGKLRSMNQREFCEILCLELIVNNFDVIGLRSRAPEDAPVQLSPTSGAGPHATPTKKKKLDKEKKETSA
jgi:hypothetical protein